MYQAESQRTAGAISVLPTGPWPVVRLKWSNLISGPGPKTSHAGIPTAQISSREAISATALSRTAGVRDSSRRRAPQPAGNAPGAAPA
jgi:hypothetical protein